MKCKNCQEIDAVKYSKYSNGNFCSRKCARGFSTKEARLEINNKVSKTLLNRPLSDSHLANIRKANKNRYAGRHSQSLKDKISKSVKKFWNDNPHKRDELSEKLTGYKHSNEAIQNMSIAQRRKCNNPVERKRLRDIGRKGGFGKKGITKNGIRYESDLERRCFNILSENNIEFKAHKPIPNSSKVSDVYLVSEDIWIEIDGIDRDKRRKWLESEYEYWTNKLDIYEKQSLSYKIIKSESDLNALLSDMNLI